MVETPLISTQSTPWWKKILNKFKKPESNNFEAFEFKYEISDLVTDAIEKIGVYPHFEDKDISKELTKEEYTALITMAYDLNKNNEFQTLLKSICKKQIDWSVKRAENMEQVNAGRFTINGVALVLDEIKKLSAIYEERKKPRKEFNEFEVI